MIFPSLRMLGQPITGMVAARRQKKGFQEIFLAAVFLVNEGFLIPLTAFLLRAGLVEGRFRRVC